MKYSTQMDAAKKGILTNQMENVLNNEDLKEEELLENLADGKLVIPANKNHENAGGIAVGKGASTKINVNLGVSEDCHNMDMELKKVEKALELKADAIMDLSTYGATREFRQKLVEIAPVMLGTVPMYDAARIYDGDAYKLSVDEIFDVVEMHAEDGIDFMTIHAGVNRESVEKMKNNPRQTDMVSRGGALLLEWMDENDRENPFFEHFDRLLELCHKYDITLSLGDGMRPGCLKDATDSAQIQELIILGELTRRAWQENVQVMIEGPGHVPLNEVITNMQLEKKLCHGAPFYVLGPVVSDVAPGYDHITSAIGGALAASSGADFLCYVTPAEHLRLPDLDDMREGIIATRIAAQAADVANGLPQAIAWENKMARARENLDWEKMFSLAMDEEKARKYRESSRPLDQEVCTMCGKMCALRKSRDRLKK
jgi:phosphomethylpyrimidine synthase